MYRTRPWMVVLLVAVTALVAGFTRLEGVHTAPPPEKQLAPHGPASAPPRDAEQMRRYLEEMLDYLQATEEAKVQPMKLPPLDELPALPAELLPAEETAADLPPNSAVRQRGPA